MNIEISAIQYVAGATALVALGVTTIVNYIRYHRFKAERFELMDQIGMLLEQKENNWDLYNQHGVIIHAVDASDLKQAVTLSAGSCHPIVCVTGRSQNPKVYESYAKSMGVYIPTPLSMEDFIGKVHTNGIILAI